MKRDRAAILLTTPETEIVGVTVRFKDAYVTRASLRVSVGVIVRRVVEGTTRMASTEIVVVAIRVRLAPLGSKFTLRVGIPISETLANLITTAVKDSVGVATRETEAVGSWIDIDILGVIVKLKEASLTTVTSTNRVGVAVRLIAPNVTR
jgi:hypothetical protein